MLRICQLLRCNIASTYRIWLSNGTDMADNNSIPPEECINMVQVRQGVDTTDAALIRLLAKRYAYMEAAARIKTDRSAVRDEIRKAVVIDNAAYLAKSLGIPSEDIRGIWDQLVESSIAYELNKWEKQQA
jgi:isochorismate pyruvate lyase